MSEAEAREQALARLDELRARFGDRLEQRLEQLEALVRRAHEDPVPEALAEALGAAHRLAGTAGSYGFDAAGEAAAALERALQRITDGDSEWDGALTSLARARQAVR